MGVWADNLKGEYFISTGSGKYLRNVELEPQNNICIVEINQAGDSWRIVWGLESGGKPTSEFPSHFMNHSVRKRVTEGKNRVIYHAHPPYVVALTYLLPLTAEAFTRVLWKSETECCVVFPGGVGVVPWMVPGVRISQRPPVRRWKSTMRQCGPSTVFSCLALILTLPSV